MRQVSVLTLVVALSLVVAALSARAAEDRSAGNPCTTLRMTGKPIAAKAGRIIGQETVAQRDSEHPNECDFFSSSTGHEARVYVWPASQETTAVQSIVGGSFAGRSIKKHALSGLGAGAESYNGVPTFVAGGHFVAIFSVGLSNAQVIRVARLIRTTLL